LLDSFRILLFTFLLFSFFFFDYTFFLLLFFKCTLRLDRGTEFLNFVL
jgi:hypothetical protein